MGLAGDLREISFADVVQLYSQSRRTAVLVVTAPDSGEELGYFYFARGELYDARLGDAEGLDAVYRALELKEGIFHIVRDVHTPQRRIFKPVGAMLLEGMRRLDEAERAAGRAAAPELTFGRSPTGDGAGEQPAEDEQAEDENMMSGEFNGGVCPTCRKRFIHGELCPHDGSRLQQPSRIMELPELTPPANVMRPMPTVLPPRRPAAWWVALAGGMGIAVALGVIWLMRDAGVVGSTPEPQPAARLPGTRSIGSEQPSVEPRVHGAVRGVSEKEVVFGMAAPMTGANKELGRQMKLGVETAFHSANEAGGIHGRQVRLVALDDGYEPTRTAVAMRDLYEKEQVFGVIGNVGTPTAMVAIPFALEHKMLFYGAFTGASILRRNPPDRYVINYRASYAEETAAVVNYLVKVRGLRPNQIAVFAQQDSYGDAGFAGVAKALRNLRVDSTAILRVGYARNTIDVSQAVQQLMDHPVSIRAVVMVGTYRACAKFIEKVRDLYPKMIFTNVSFVGSTALADELRLLGPRYADGVIVTQVVPPVESHATAVLKYKEALAKYFPGETPDYVSLEGYLAAGVLLEALTRAGRDLETELLIDTFESIRDLDLGLGAPISFGLTEHQGSHKVWGTQLDAQANYQVLELE